MNGSTEHHRRLTVDAAWLMRHRIREAWSGPNGKARWFSDTHQIDGTFWSWPWKGSQRILEPQVASWRLSHVVAAGKTTRRRCEGSWEVNRVSAAVVKNTDL